MENDFLINKLGQIEDLINFTNSAIEVVANSCSYNDDYSGENILRLAFDTQYEILDKISYLQTYDYIEQSQKEKSTC